MGYPTKIATCCYCGSRAALVLGKDRHELTCANCGAPLHDMKRLKQEHSTDRQERGYVPSKPLKKSKNRKYQADYAQRRKPVKRRKGLMRHILEEAFDVIEDIFD